MDPADPASLVRSPSPLLSTPSMVTVDTFQTAEEAQSSSRRSSHETIQVPRILTPDTVSIASEASPLQPARALLPPHPRHLSSFTHTLTNIANMLIGIGILALPKALEMTGWVPGFLLMVSVCDATVYTANLLSRCMDAPISGEEGGRGKRAMTYSDVGRRAFGPAGETFVGLVVGLDLIVVSITYLILCLDSIGQLWPEVRGKVGLHVVVGVAVAPLTFLGNMRWLSYVGVFGLLSIAFLLVALVALVALGLLHQPPRHALPTGSILHPSPTHLVSNHVFRNLPLSFGILMAALAGHIVLPTMKREMKDESKFPKSVATSYLLVILVYAVFASAGYLMFGKWTVTEITANLARLASEGRYPGWVAKACVGMWVVNPLSKVGVVLEVVGRMAEGAVAKVVEKLGGDGLVQGRARMATESVQQQRPQLRTEIAAGRATTNQVVEDRRAFFQRRPSSFKDALSLWPPLLDEEAEVISDTEERSAVETSTSEDDEELFPRLMPVFIRAATPSGPSEEEVDIEVEVPITIEEQQALLPPRDRPRPSIEPPDFEVTKLEEGHGSPVAPKIRIAIRLVLLAVSMLCAYLVPSFLRASVLLGCMLATTTAILFPCACYLKIGANGVWERTAVGGLFAAAATMGLWGTIAIMFSKE